MLYHDMREVFITYSYTNIYAYIHKFLAPLIDEKILQIMYSKFITIFTEFTESTSSIKHNAIRTMHKLAEGPGSNSKFPAVIPQMCYFS